MRPISGIPSIFVATLLVIVAVPMGIATLLVWWHSMELREAHDTRALHSARFVADSLSRVPASQREPWLKNLLGPSDGGPNVQSIRVVGRAGQNMLHVSLSDAAGGDVFEARSRNGESVQFQVLPPGAGAGWAWGLGVALLLSSAAAAAYFIGMSPFASSIVASLEEVTRALLTFRQSNFKARVGETGYGRFRALEKAVNSMGERLEVQMQQARETEELATEELQTTLEEVEIKNVELDLARKRALDDARVKSRFLANMSHEIRTPMNSIVGYAQLLKATRLDEAQQGYADSIGQSAATLLDIIEDILSLARLEAGKLVLASQEFDIRRIVRQSVDMLAPMAYQKGLGLRTIVESDVPVCFLGDALRIRQILVNLLSNAVKYTATGDVEITVRAVRQAGRNAVLFLGVADTGRGISREDRARLFEAFTGASRQEHQGGAGLGLTITRALTNAMGGQLSLESEVNVGSTFLVRLPLKTDYDETYDFLEPLAGKRVLLAMSDPVVERNFIEHLGSAQIELAGQLAPEALLQPSWAPQDCDIVVTDCGTHQAEDLCRRWPADAAPGVVLVPTADNRILNRVAAAVRGTALPAYAGGTHILAAIARQFDIQIARFDTPAVELPAPHVAGARALIADDDRLGRTYLKELLTQHGVDVTTCADGQEAVTIAADVPFDIIFMDARMPLCDGVEATRRIRAGSRNESTPIVALTASALSDDRRLFASAGMDECLVKPAAPDQLLEMVAKSVASEPRTGAPQNPDGAGDHLDGEMRAMLQTELTDYRRTLVALQENFDRNKLLHVVHRLHGAAAICALPALEAESAALEAALRADATDEAGARLCTLLRCVDESIAEGEAL